MKVIAVIILSYYLLALQFCIFMNQFKEKKSNQEKKKEKSKEKTNDKGLCY